MPEEDKYIIYWAKLESHDDPWRQGYIGYSGNTLDERKRSHYKKAKSNKQRNVHFHNALERYKEKVEWSIIEQNLTKDEALVLEEKYRPRINMGWNTDKGGVEAVSSEWYENIENKEAHRQRTSEATKKKIAEKDTPEARSKRAKAVWSDPEYKKLRAGEISGENNPAFGLFGKDHPAAGHTKTEAGKKAISNAHKGKKISDAQKKAISKARSKSIGVYDKDRETMYNRRMAGDSVHKIALDYPISTSSVDRNIRNWWRKNKLPKPPKYNAKSSQRTMLDHLTKKLQKSKDQIFRDKIASQKKAATILNQMKLILKKKNQFHKNEIQRLGRILTQSKRNHLNKLKVSTETHRNHSKKIRLFKKDLNNLTKRLVQSKDQIFRDKVASQKKAVSHYNQIRLFILKKIKIHKNELKYFNHALNQTKHIIDRETGKFQGENARASKFTDSERAIICRRRDNGETYSKIGKSYGRGVTTIKNICQTWGPKNGYPYEPKIGKSDLKKVTSPEVKTAICKDYSKGVSAMKLATKYNVSFQMVYTYLADWGPKNNIPYKKQSSD